MLPRSVAARSNAFVTRRVVVRRLPQARFQSTASSSGSSSRSYDASHVAAGVAGGLTVTVAGYAWYHTSGLKTVVQTSKDMKSYLQSTRDKVLTKANETAKNPSQALSNLRDIAKSYTFYIPGAGSYIDDTFEELQYIYEKHADEMDSILKETSEELIRATQNGRPDAETARNIASIVGKAISKMKQLGDKVGGTALDMHPAAKEMLGSSYEQFQNLAQKAGSEGKKALKEVKDQVQELVSKNKLDEGSVKKVLDTIQEKTSSLRKQVGESGVVEEIFRNVPDKDELFKKAPNVQALLDITKERSEEAKDLAKETVSDVLSVLEEKGKKAKEISERVKRGSEK
ncbi:hypothetical protein ACEPAF_7793 [Sanghuangporus sanghuang]